MDDTYLTCSDESHIWQGSLYAKDKVPYNLFKKNNSNELYKTCIDCRNYTNIKNKIHSKENKEKYFNSELNKKISSDRCRSRSALAYTHRVVVFS